MRFIASWVLPMTGRDDFIDGLVGELSPVGRNALRLRLAWVIAIGLTGAMVALVLSLFLRPHLHHVTVAAFWVKFLYTAALMAATVIGLLRVARPDGALGVPGRAGAAALSVMAVLAVVQLALSPASSYHGLVFGYSALFCPFLICAFGLPAFCANIWFLRRAAPINPVLAGFVAGACAGATGAWVYSWACVENGIPFIAIWYTGGILLSGLAGSLVGRFCLRW